MTKLRINRGETLVEVLASILVVALSVSLLFSFIMSSSELDKRAQKADEGQYNAIAGAEAGPDAGETQKAGEANVIIYDSAETPLETIPVDIYGGDGVFSYYRRQS